MGISLHRQFALGDRAKRPLSLWSFFSSMIALRRQRNRLLALDAHLLADIGISRAAALAESDKNLWDVPQNWRN